MIVLAQFVHNTSSICFCPVLYPVYFVFLIGIMLGFWSGIKINVQTAGSAERHIYTFLGSRMAQK